MTFQIRDRREFLNHLLVYNALPKESHQCHAKRNMIEAGPKFQIKKLINLIRVLFPNWNFFNQVAYEFNLWVLAPGATDWTLLSFDQKRKVLGVFVNPEVNLALAKLNLLEHFAQDLQSDLADEDVTQLTTYRMVKSLVTEKLIELKIDPKARFKLVANNPSETLDLFVSDETDI
ncbi:hypothetical protein ACES2L_15010 [Bdellovibrio bacteriovorus]